MILSELRNFLAEHRRATLSVMAHHFDADGEAVRGMLDVLVRKGKVRRVHYPTDCGATGCSCPNKEIDVYEWVMPKHW